MSRPNIKIKTTNEIESFRTRLDELLPQLKELPGLVGIALHGGLSRGYADYLSEIDLILYFDPATYQDWKNSKTPLPLGITKIGGTLYDIEVVDFMAERQAKWDEVALWDASYAEFLYDPDHQIEQLYREKLSEYPALERTIGLMFSSWWYYRLAGDIWIYRGDGVQGHYVLNRALTPLLESLYIANREFIPHDKWILHMSRTLEWMPKKWDIRLKKAMSTGNFSISSLRRRQSAIDGLWNDINQYMISAYFPGLPVSIMQKTVYDRLKNLVEKGRMPVGEWEKQAPLEMLNEEPFYRLVNFENGEIVVDRARLLEISPEEMYSWHYEILKAVITEYLNKGS